nr:MAG TPA_asm: hypothetical protein [Caudoviricetes sp.]
MFWLLQRNDNYFAFAISYSSINLERKCFYLDFLVFLHKFNNQQYKYVSK